MTLALVTTAEETAVWVQPLQVAWCPYLTTPARSGQSEVDLGTRNQ